MYFFIWTISQKNCAFANVLCDRQTELSPKYLFYFSIHFCLITHFQHKPKAWIIKITTTVAEKFHFWKFQLSDGFFLISSFFPYLISKNNPKNTNTIAKYCWLETGFLKKITLHKMVKNFLVVVIIEQVKGPKVTTVWKINDWPAAEHNENKIMYHQTWGYLAWKVQKVLYSPVHKIRTAKLKQE